ncbi:ROK family protein [Phycicoccus sonneratiae]|uniref:ROK family protein n=1 Tax=Phycicoccus sonneratiae TaxID=2807628 RepID=A0ABS2CIZ3_9MICO|nr:ROK family protein [Phycicoccus sonneraticus]MBM6399844.1 ROK family protein [Phycicoccus sonneraticus]
MSPTPRRVSTSTAVLPADGRRQNLSLVLQTLRRLGPTSRAQLAREVGVTKVTMSDLVAELIGEGRVRDVGTAEQAGPGKPATLVDLDRSGLLTLAVDLSVPARLQAAVVDVTGAVLHREERAAAVDADEGRGLDPAVVVELVRSVLAVAPHPVLGIGIGTPGLVDPEGTVRTAPNLGWTDVALRALVAEATGLPVLVTNDSDAATQAELSATPGSQDLVLVQVGRGVGCGVVSGGRLVRGAHHAAGEIGHVTVGTDGGETCSCGRRGCLETWLSVPRLRAAADAGEDPASTESVVEVGGHRLAVALAPLVAALDLSEVVLAGPAALLEPVVPVVARSLADRLLPSLDTPLTVRLATSPEDIVLRGAAALVLWDRLGVV